MSVGSDQAGDSLLYQHISDYVFSMAVLNRREARRCWRAAIKKAWNNCCAYCGKPPIDDSSLTIDHVKPKSKGGEDCTSNVIPACKKCNAQKGSEEWVSWYRMQSFYSVESENRIKKWLLSAGLNNTDTIDFENML